MSKQIAKSKTEKVVKTSGSKPAPTSASLPFVFGKENYMLMSAGVLVIILGFLLMSGGKTNDPNVFPAEEIYSFRRITLAPIVVLIGFFIEIFAILKRPSKA